MFNNLVNITLIARGDQRRFRQLMEITNDELFLFAMGFLHNKEVAEEVVSDVYVKIWNNRAKLENIKNLRSYLFVAVKNGCLTQLKKARKIPFVSLDNISEFYLIPVDRQDDASINDELISRIYLAIAKLPPKCKLAFSLAKINGMKRREIAEIMGISEKTVNNHLVLAVKKITDFLKLNKTTSKKFSYLNRAGIFSF